MRFPRYPEYKDSGAEWLGEVPAHWEVKRLDHYFQERREKVSDKDHPPLSVTRNGVVPQLETAAKTDDGDNRKLVRAGDFVINGRSDRKGSSGSSELDGSVSLISIVLKPREGIVSRFAHHLLRSVTFQEEFYRYGKGIVADLWSTNYSEMRNIVLAVPPPDEQHSIVAFLEDDLAKVDGLISEQEKLIALLKEKRQAVISHAVTKGLNPNVPVKDSGIEWLGKVPAHWDVGCLKRFWTVTDCKHITAEFVDDGIPLASIRESQSRYVDLDEAKRTTAEYYEQLIEGGRKPAAGDLVFTRNATVGEVAQVAEWHPPFALGQDVCLLRRLDFSGSADFMQAVLRSELVKTQLDLAMIGSTFKRINVEEIRGLVVPYPPHEEQSKISAHLLAAIAGIDQLVGLAEAGTSLLSERRSALVSAAVTGKIDVSYRA